MDVLRTSSTSITRIYNLNIGDVLEAKGLASMETMLALERSPARSAPSPSSLLIATRYQFKGLAQLLVLYLL